MTERGGELDDGYNRLLQSSWRLLRDNQQATGSSLPWESNPWLRRTLGTPNSLFGADMPVALHVPHPQTAAVKSPETPEASFVHAGGLLTSKSAMTRVTRKLRDLDWLSALGKARREAVAKWQLLIGLSPMAFAVGRQLSVDSARKATDEEMQASIGDSLASRASKTLVTRAGSMFRYVAYCRVVGRLPFPMVESLAYSYVTNLADTKARPTVAKSFLSAVAFCLHVLALRGASDVLESGRVGGSAHKQYECKAPLKQAKTLTVAMVDALENGIFLLNNAKDQVACGFFLYCFYARARFNDAQAVELLELDDCLE
jgi:hypothetical protein